MSEQNPTPPDVDPVDQTDEVAAVRREVKERRFALRQTEAERDALRERLDARDRQDVEKMAAARLADPGDLWLTTSLDAMRSEDGTIDTERASTIINELVAAKPHYAKQPERKPPDLRQGPRGTVEPDGPSFGQSVKKALGR